MKKSKMNQNKSEGMSDAFYVIMLELNPVSKNII